MFSTSELLSRARSGDNGACEQMLEENAGLIWSVARRYFGRGVDPEDLYQLGCIGFLKAVRGFNDSYGTQFSTYAVPKISGEIRRFLRDDGTVKVSRSLKEQAINIHNARARLYQSTGCEPTISQLCKETGLTCEEIAAAETAAAPTQSLQFERGEDGFTLENLLGDSGIEEAVVENLSLKQAIDTLPEKERTTICLRYYHHMTQDQCAKIIGVSQVQVSRLERRAIARLRETLSNCQV